MNLAVDVGVGIVAVVFGCWLMWRQWILCLLGVPMIVGGAFLIFSATLPFAKAEPAPKPDIRQQIEQWLWPRRDKPAPVPVPTPRPQNEVPAPVPVPPPPVVETVPEPIPAPPPVVETTPAPAPVPPPKIEKGVGRDAPPPRKKFKRERTQEDRPKSKSSQGTLTAAECPSCDRVRMGASMPCWVIVANAGSYDRRCEPHARRCISAAQYRAVKACFKK